MNHTMHSHKILAGAVGLLALLVFSACEARTKLVDSWENEKASGNKPDKIAVIAVLPDALMRQVVEIDVAKELRKKDRNVVEASKIKGLTAGIRGKIDTEVAVKALQAASVDGVIVMFYSGGGVSGTYSRSDYWLQYEGTAVGGWGAYNWGQPYFTNVYSVQQGPGYTEFSRSALIESSYYDLETREPVWRIVTETTDTEHSDTTMAVAKKIASQMRKSGL